MFQVFSAETRFAAHECRAVAIRTLGVLEGYFRNDTRPLYDSGSGRPGEVVDMSAHLERGGYLRVPPHYAYHNLQPCDRVLYAMARKFGWKEGCGLLVVNTRHTGSSLFFEPPRQKGEPDRYRRFVNALAGVLQAHPPYPHPRPIRR